MINVCGTKFKQIIFAIQYRTDCNKLVNVFNDAGHEIIAK